MRAAKGVLRRFLPTARSRRMTEEILRRSGLDDGYRAIGYMTVDGRLYAGCPGLEVQDGWQTVYVKAKP